MARTADKTGSYIAMVLDLNGRVRSSDLQSVPAESRLDALRAFAQAHGSHMQLHFAGDELVAGPLPDPAAFEFAPVAAAPPPAISPDPAPSPVAPSFAPMLDPAPVADLTPEGESAIDLLLGDFDGAPELAAVDAGEPSAFAAAEAPTSSASAPNRVPVPSASPAPAAPAADAAARDTGRAWLLWWIPTLLLPVIGGSAAWFFLRRHKRQFAARAMLAVALVTGLLLSTAWLRYAERIAAVTSQRAADSVITLPDSEGTPDPATGAASAPDAPSSNTQ